ncbi:MAG TPA: ERF family protein [Dissulfurispiraceae bacterium]|nr:ERF family protein [Dissulfurispiraceae bacterium]
MNKSETIASLATALSAAQGEMENASKNSLNPHFRSKYADLAEVINTVRPVLSKHGLSVMQFPSYSDGIVHVETVIAHTSGEWMSEKCSAPAQKQDPQGVGSAISYLRRYSLAAVCNLAQEDDDANAASKAPKQAAKPMPAPATAQKPAPAPPVKNVQASLATLDDLASYYKEDSEEYILYDINEKIRKAKPGAERIDQLTDLTEAQAQWLIKAIEAQIQKEAV